MKIDFEPLFSLFWIGAILLPLALLIIVSLIFKSRGSFLRLLALCAFAIALLNPVFLQEVREKLKTVIAIIADRSPSQSIGERSTDTDIAVKALQEKFKNLDQYELRIIDAGKSTDDNTANSTRLFTALNSALRDVPPSRIGGAVMITDGQVHDIPNDAAALNFNSPLHALITGKPDEFDRRISFIQAPRFGIAGQEIEMSYHVTDEGKSTDSTAKVAIKINGTVIAEQTALIDQETKFKVTIPKAGVNIVEISTPEIPNELSRTNNLAVATVDGIRENLRVLLVSGEPHNGERAWRDLLKSDAGVDLVHFTILRPPEKQDGTPIEELSLIVFPTRELFVDKINEFDLIIFDRYQHRDVLPLLYYDFIAQYVETGGALLVASGPEYADYMSIAHTPLYSVLPALPTGNITEKAFYPRLTDAGKRHPVTRDLQGSDQEPPQWGRWFRAIDTTQPLGETIMQGPDGKPLLVLNRVGKGRVGMLMSDQGWLWSRNFEGGGPYAPLYRRIAHWLMQESELEEEALTATGHENKLHIRRQTMNDKPEKATVTAPSGAQQEIVLKQTEPGLFEADIDADEIGIYQVKNDGFEALAHIGPVNSPETNEIISSTQKLAPIIKATSGNIIRLHPTNESPVTIPEIKTVSQATTNNNGDQLNFVETSDTQLQSVSRISLFSGFAALGIMLLLIGGVWYRESR